MKFGYGLFVTLALCVFICGAVVYVAPSVRWGSTDAEPSAGLIMAVVQAPITAAPSYVGKSETKFDDAPCGKVWQPASDNAASHLHTDHILCNHSDSEPKPMVGPKTRGHVWGG